MQAATAEALGIGVPALLMHPARRIGWYAYTPALGEPPAAIMEKP